MQRQRGFERASRILLGIFLLLSPFFASLSEGGIKQGTVEFLLGSYNIREPRFTAVYKEGGAIRGMALSSSLAYNFNFYLEIKYFSKSGELTYSKDKTDFKLLPISLGVRYIHPLGLFHPYVGAGADFYIYYEDNPIGTVLNYTNGYHVMGGTYIQFGKLPLFLNLKLKYTKAQAEENDREIALGGFEYGAGLAITF